ncbi:MAG: pilus assembly protein [Rhodospirillaceae bacterium]|nr:pilus assembly protein [Rhodospirillales bacterium]
MLRTLLRNRRGATAVEFALVLPVFLSFLLGTMEVGRFLWVRSTLQFAAEEATRYAIAHSTAGTAEISAQAKASLAGLESASVQINVASSSATVTVRLTHDFQLVTAGLLPFSTVSLSATSQFPRN